MASQNQNSLQNIIGIFGDLGSKLNLLTKDTPEIVEADGGPLEMVMNNLEDLEETFQLFQKEIIEEPSDDVFESFNQLGEAVRELSTEVHAEILEEIQEASDNMEEDGKISSFGELVGSSVVGLVNGEEVQLTYIDLILLAVFILGVFFIFSLFILMISYCWRKMFGKKESWKDLSDSETDSSVSWVSINTTTTEDSPVKPASNPADVSSVQTVVQTDKIPPITEHKILMVPGEFVLDRGTQWCRTEISSSIIV